jgi:iodotyrosine deiodinase
MPGDENMQTATSGEESSRYPFAPLDFTRLPEAEALARSREFLAAMQRRRSVRAFAPDPVPFELVRNAVATAATAPSGANQQPWRFVVVANPDLKRRMRALIEDEERANYEERFPPAWLAALAPLGTDWHKEFIEIAPYVIVVFAESYGLAPDGTHVKHYYTSESVSIAVGFLIVGLHLAGLVTLTHTPNPMGGLRDLLGRPPNEKPLIVLPVGYPAPGCRVPVLSKKPLDAILLVK